MNSLKQSSDSSPDFEALMTAIRPRLRAFLLSLTGSEAAAEDLTQDTSVVLWEKRDKYDPEGDFRAWAFRIGFFQVQNYRRKLARQQNRELPGDDLFEEIADQVTERHGSDDEDLRRHAAMITCLGKLKEDHRDLVLNRYQEERSLAHLASDEGINRNAMAQKLFRLKRTLLTCVEKQLSMGNRDKSL
tara:strand:- start:194 stop:757 length:564 start_codon:yes stop_codon:yes gene_type:complete